MGLSVSTTGNADRARFSVSPSSSVARLSTRSLFLGMEDSHSVHLYLPPSDDAASPDASSSEPIPTQPQGSTVTNNAPGKTGPAFFGVFDGHGGSTVAKFAGTTLHERIAELPAYSASLSGCRVNGRMLMLLCRVWGLRGSFERGILQD